MASASGFLFRSNESYKVFENVNVLRKELITIYILVKAENLRDTFTKQWIYMTFIKVRPLSTFLYTLPPPTCSFDP